MYNNYFNKFHLYIGIGAVFNINARWPSSTVVRHLANRVTHALCAGVPRVCFLGRKMGITEYISI